MPSAAPDPNIWAHESVWLDKHKYDEAELRYYLSLQQLRGCSSRQADEEVEPAVNGKGTEQVPIDSRPQAVTVSSVDVIDPSPKVSPDSGVEMMELGGSQRKTTTDSVDEDLEFDIDPEMEPLFFDDESDSKPAPETKVSKGANQPAKNPVGAAPVVQKEPKVEKPAETVAIGVEPPVCESRDVGVQSGYDAPMPTRPDTIDGGSDKKALKQNLNKEKKQREQVSAAAPVQTPPQPTKTTKKEKSGAKNKRNSAPTTPAGQPPTTLAFQEPTPASVPATPVTAAAETAQAPPEEATASAAAADEKPKTSSKKRNKKKGKEAKQAAAAAAAAIAGATAPKPAATLAKVMESATPKPAEAKVESLPDMRSYTELLSRLGQVEDENTTLKKSQDALQSLVKKLEERINSLEGRCPKACAPTPASTSAAKPAAKAADDDDDVDLFGSDNEDDPERERLHQERLQAYEAKKSKKPALIAKSNVILDVKPWDDETDMKAMETQVRTIKMDGLIWGASKLVPLAYGINKLQISCVVEDDKVSVDELQEKIEAIEELVQSVDIAAFNKV